MTYHPGTVKKADRVEAALIALTKATVQAYAALGAIAAKTSDLSLQAELTARLQSMSGAIDEAVEAVKDPEAAAP